MKAQQLLTMMISTLFALVNPCEATTQVSLYSGTFEGDHPAPVFVGKAKLGDRFRVEVQKAIALVNYPDPASPVITKRVIREEVGGNVTCPWFIKLDGSPMGTRIDEEHTAKFSHVVVCDDKTCTDKVGNPIPVSQLLFGKYNLLKCTMSDGTDYGFFDKHWIETPTPDCPPPRVCGPKLETIDICCKEFSVERIFDEIVYLDQMLILDSYREQELTDLDVDLRTIYLIVENERGERANCSLGQLSESGNFFRLSDLRDCVLPTGSELTLYAQSRFFLKKTRPCGKFVAPTSKVDGKDVPDWFLGWYECDGKLDRDPINKQYTYSTRVDLNFTKQNIDGGLR